MMMVSTNLLPDRLRFLLFVLIIGWNLVVRALLGTLVNKIKLN